MGCGCNPRTGKCFDPEDEGPSEADLARFGGVILSCPNCTTDVHDEAALCPTCGYAMGDVASEPATGKSKYAVGTAVVIIGAFLIFMVRNVI